MLLGIPQSLATLLTILLFYAMDFVLIRRYDKKRQASGSGRAWDFTFFIFAMVAVLVLQPVLLPGLSFKTTEPWGVWMQMLGLIVIVVSLGLHYWSRVHLQQYYAERVEVQPDHQVIRTGPYALMRHPVITSFFGIATGLFLINPALTTIFALVYTLWDFSRAARQEEELLSQTLPGYAEYAHQTPRYLPRLWRSS
ncbi:MAG: methyltransferase family protein [Bacteroidota bacterium]